MEVLITALSSDQLSAAAYYSVRINPRATTASGRATRRTDGEQIKFGGRVNAITEYGEPAKISIARVISLNECTF